MPGIVGQKGYCQMRSFAFLLIGSLLLATAPAEASPSCLKGNKPYQLNGDTIAWSMEIKAGADCIQGIRWSFMQVYAVWVLQKPANGELVIVGSGFRYYAKPGFSGADKFSLVVVGKNRHEQGYSTVEVTVSQLAAPPLVLSAVDQPKLEPGHQSQ
jgi:hypothetical protein